MRIEGAIRSGYTGSQLDSVAQNAQEPPQSRARNGSGSQEFEMLPPALYRAVVASARSRDQGGVVELDRVRRRPDESYSQFLERWRKTVRKQLREEVGFNAPLNRNAKRNANRVTIAGGHEAYFPIKQGSKVYATGGDGRMVEIGRNTGEAVNNRSVRVNYGQRKVVDGVTYLYTLASGKTNEGNTVSGWIRLADFPRDARVRYREDGETHITSSTTAGFLQKGKPLSRVVALREGSAREGVPADVRTYDQVQGSRFGDMARELKVVPGSRERNEKMGDYLPKEATNAINLLYNLPGYGGVATDTFVPASDGSAPQFVPAKGVARVRIPLYLPANAGQEMKQAWASGDLPRHAEFIYGSIEGRNGWIAQAALRPNRAEA